MVGERGTVFLGVAETSWQDILSPGSILGQPVKVLEVGMLVFSNILGFKIVALIG